MTWVEEVRLRVEALSMPIPEDAVCSQHGVGFKLGIKRISLMSRGGLLLITVYASPRRGFSDRTFRRWRRDIQAIAPIFEYWSGKGGNDGISIVLDLPTPYQFFRALRRYRDISFITVDAFQRFDVAYEKNFSEVRKQDEEKAFEQN